MSQRELGKVFRGVGMVASIIAKENRSFAKEKIDRAVFHATELAKLCVEIYNESNSTKQSSSNHNGFNDKSQANNKANAMHDPVNTNLHDMNNQVTSTIPHIDIHTIMKESFKPNKNTITDNHSTVVSFDSTQNSSSEGLSSECNTTFHEMSSNNVNNVKTQDFENVSESSAESSLDNFISSVATNTESIHVSIDKNVTSPTTIATTTTTTTPMNTTEIMNMTTTSSSPPTPDLIGFSDIKKNSLHDTNDEIIYHDSNNMSTEMATKITMKPKKVPSTQLERVFGFGGLAAGLIFGKVKETTSNAIYGNSNSSSSSSSGTMSQENANRLADSLSRMRGAALKLGQMMSIQDENVLPPALAQALNRVRQGADYMPTHQLEYQIKSQLGTNWRSLFLEFNDIPIAAASIGQVHKAVLKTGETVAVKIQYPGVADSIESDLNNLKLIINVANLLPKGLFIDQIIRVAATELTAECDYLAEARHQKRYHELIINDPILHNHFHVPHVYTDYSSSQILTTEFVYGIPIDQARQYPQNVRNAIARAILIATIKELFEWRFIQSDPNFANFLYHHSSLTIHCLDFGAAREYSDEFVDNYMELVWAAANLDKDVIIDISKKLGFLSGDESAEMISAHVQTGLLVGEPFQTYAPFDFAANNITRRASQHGEVFMTQRLKAPPVETYSLHRKLAGAFLLCIRLKAVIPCRDILEDVYMKYKSQKKQQQQQRQQQIIVST